MDERYNYFYEQRRNDGLDWDAVYKEYYPKFAALKSYKKEGFTLKRFRTMRKRRLNI